ncbi:MAG TPA: hypothetical protein VGM98_25370 [Schlesneria sp.]
MLIFTVRCVTIALVINLIGCTGAAQDAVKVQPIYDASPSHLWNRVHAALLCRVGPDGKTYGEDRLEPLLWMHSEHLLRGKSFENAVAVLDEFDREGGESLIETPIKKAILQRDLWLVATWLTQKPDTEEKQRLQSALAKVIRRLALSSEQIEKLPDNYTSTVAAKVFSSRFDTWQPERSYLPAQVFDPEGPWVCIGRGDGLIAPQHLREDSSSPFTNSVFLIFLKLSSTRVKTLQFLTELETFKQPYLVDNPNPSPGGMRGQSHPRLPNAALPKWPKGTEVALVRRALLINTNGKIVASPITESLQLRVMRTNTPEPSAAMFNIENARGNWAFFEFQFRRTDLLGPSPIGLRDVSGDRDFKTGFMSHPSDGFDEPSQPSKPFPLGSQPFQNNRASCIGCHQLPGLYSFNSLAGFQFGRLRNSRDKNAQKIGPFQFKTASIPEIEAAVVQWKETQASWKQFGVIVNQ